MRSYYSASKFALDGFGKALQAEVAHLGINILQCYPAYVKTNISKNALTGEGIPLGMTDKNIENGISVENACDDIIKAIYLRRNRIIIGSPFYQIIPMLCALSETLTYYLGKFNAKQ